MRLIDADELLEKYESYGNTSPIALTFIDDLNEMPTVEQKHGHWETTEAYPHWMCCSVCHKKMVPNIEWIDNYDIPKNYCPNCGAKMEVTE